MKSACWNCIGFDDYYDRRVYIAVYPFSIHECFLNMGSFVLVNIRAMLTPRKKTDGRAIADNPEADLVYSRMQAKPCLLFFDDR